MLVSALVAFAHFAAAFALAASLVYERAVFNRHPSASDVRRLAAADRWYGLASVVLLGAGFARAIWFEKGWAFYAANPFFHLKITLFVIVGLLSIYPTVMFIRWSKAAKQGQAPVVTDLQYRRLSLVLNLEIAALLLIVASASLMAHGVMQIAR